MERIYLSKGNWQPVKSNRAWKITLFVFGIFFGLCLLQSVVVSDKRIKNLHRDNAFLKAENTCLKGEINSVNERLIEEYSYTDRVLKFKNQ